jgi:hypothetical protein
MRSRSCPPHWPPAARLSLRGEITSSPKGALASPHNEGRGSAIRDLAEGIQRVFRLAGNGATTFPPSRPGLAPYGSGLRPGGCRVLPFRHGRPCAGHPRLAVLQPGKSRLARPSPAMTQHYMRPPSLDSSHHENARKRVAVTGCRATIMVRHVLPHQNAPVAALFCQLGRHP